VGLDARVATKGVHLTPAPLGAASKQPSGAPDQKTPVAIFPSQAAIRPATVSLHDGILKVEASNSDLSQILQDLADRSGMIIKGLRKGPQIFGIYGPAKPREVLSELLVGTGYNFVFVGGATDGPPRELILTAQNSIDPTVASDITRSALPAESEQIMQEMHPSESSELGPGAVSPVPSQDDQDANTRSLRNLQRLQHMQEQQQQAPR